MTFKPSEWAVVVPKRKHGVFDSPYAEPASIVTQETGSELDECMGCGQLREHVTAVKIDGEEIIDVCPDCRREHGL